MAEMELEQMDKYDKLSPRVYGNAPREIFIGDRCQCLRRESII